VIVTGAVPLDVKVSGSDAPLFTVTLPKLSDVVLEVSCGVAAVVPLPLNATLTLAGVALLVMVSVSASAPAVAGSKSSVSAIC
jgi:hypothetical protein